MKQVWIGLLDLTQIPGEQLITLSQGAALTWFTCWADSVESFEIKATEVMRHSGLHVIGFEEVCPTCDFEAKEENLVEQIDRTRKSESYSLYGTFHGYPPRLC